MKTNSSKHGFKAILWLSKNMLNRELRILWLVIPICSVILIFSSLVNPMMMRALFDAMQLNDAQRLLQACLIMAGVIAFVVGMQYIGNTYMDMYIWRIMYAGKREGFMRYQQLPWQESVTMYEEGDVFARLNNGGESGNAWYDLSVAILNMALCVLMLLWGGSIAWQLALWVAGILALSILTSAIQVKRTEPLQERLQAAHGECEQQLQGLTHGMQFAAMNDMTTLLHDRYAQKRKALWRVMQDQVTLQMALEALLYGGAAVLRAGMAWVMMPLKLGLGAIVAGFTMLEAMTNTGFVLGSYMNRFISNSVQAARLYDMLQQKRTGQAVQLNTNAAITVQNASLTLGDRTVLSDINLTIQPGEKVALIGRNGCGKSTLMRVMLGFYKLDSGSAALKEQDAAYMSHEQRRELVSFIPSRHQLFSESGLDNVAMNAADSELDRVEQALVWAEADFAQQDASTLSGGQMQRVNVARGLAHRAPVCLADEPEASLDRETGERVLRQIVEQTQTLVAVTHHPENLQYFDRVVILEEGRVVCDGTPKTVNSHPAYQAWEQEMAVG